jgi:hypothetical protein
MSNKRYDICTPRKGRDDKTFWTRIGTAWEGDKGIQLVFDALPLPDADGRCVANLFEPRTQCSPLALTMITSSPSCGCVQRRTVIG